MRSTSVIFEDGTPLWVTGPGINKLQTKGIQYMTCDEPWLYEPGILAEADGRLGDFARMQRDKMFLCSQAGVEDDDLDVQWRAGQCAEWEVECQSCRKYIEPLWSNLMPDKTRHRKRWNP
jgi:hypothetical protein